MVQQQLGSGPSAVFFIIKELPGQSPAVMVTLRSDLFKLNHKHVICGGIRSCTQKKFNHHASYNLINRKNC
jgi:hypothetical protein